MYLILVVVVESTVLWPATETPLDIFKGSNLFLTPIQGLLGIALGFFFTQRRGRARNPQPSQGHTANPKRLKKTGESSEDD